MKKLILATAALITLTGATAALAAEASCKVDKAEWQSEQALRDKLTALKWTIKKIKIDNGCYEVYGTDDKGQKVEVYFNPKLLETVTGEEG